VHNKTICNFDGCINSVDREEEGTTYLANVFHGMALLLTEWDKQIMDACDIHKTIQKIETIFVSFLWCTVTNQICIITIHDQQSYKE
jgi:hypothetical protein